MKLQVYHKKATQFQFSINQFLNELQKLINDGKLKTIVKCFDDNGKEIATGYVRKIDFKNRLLYLTFSANCKEIEIKILSENESKTYKTHESK